MKNEIAVRPVFLHNDDRIRALVFVSVLALMVYTLLEILARRSRIASVWGSRDAPITARQLLLFFARVALKETTMKDRSRLRVIERLDPRQSRIIKRLGLPMPETYVKA
jgi:transposase